MKGTNVKDYFFPDYIGNNNKYIYCYYLGLNGSEVVGTLASQ